MDMRSRNQYLETLLERYLKADKAQKGQLLDEYCGNTGQNRKYVIRKISRMAFGPPRERKKRAVVYGPAVRAALEALWKVFDFPCGQRLAPVVRAELYRLRRMKELDISEQTAEKLLRISPATIDRLLRPKKGEIKDRRRYSSRGANLIAKKIPLRMTDWETSRVGYVEMDLVLHCGVSTDGEYAHSLSAMEISTGWWEGEVVMGRAQIRIFNALKEIRERSPFTWLGIDSDNDNAFINDQLYKYSQDQHLEFTRSRPYRKNDNAYIEQKNFTHIRKPLGYLRYDTPEELAVIQDLYRRELRLYKNFFQPVMKLVRKERIGGQLKRVYDTPKTPYQRLMESNQIAPQAAIELHQLYLSLNPAELKRQIDKKLSRLFDLYQKKKKRTLTINPYKKQEPSMVTFYMIQQSESRLPR
jgi:hypothetical protein